ncbi:MAG: PAAR-like domain-containing protein [Myxococcota bacterium]
MKTGVNPPKTPVTKGSMGITAATMPNICKMPGPPAPFVPAPLPNIGKSGDNLKGATKKVKIEGKVIAIKGATFKSMGDVPSKGTGGGMVSANTHGPSKFVSPGSMNTKAEGKNIHLLSEPTTNNNSNPPNSGTTMLAQAATAPAIVAALEKIAEECEDQVGNVDPNDPDAKEKCKKRRLKDGKAKHDCCAEKVEQAQADRAKNGQPPNAYSEPAYTQSTGQAITRNNPLGGTPPQVPRTQQAIVRQARGFFRSGNSPFSSINGAVGAMCGGKKFPDVVVPSNPNAVPSRGNVDSIHDFKFPCPKGGKQNWTKDKSGQMQNQVYDSMLQPNTPSAIVAL